MEDVGYETAKIKGVDVVGNMVTMLRQRGMKVVELYGLPVEIMPLTTITATPEDERSSTQSILACLLTQSDVAPPAGLLSSSPTASMVLKAKFVGGPCADSSASHHLTSGVFGVGDELWAFMILSGKVGIKQIRTIRNAYAHSPPPKKIMLVTREAVTAQAAETIRNDGIHLEKFLLQELSYNITRHFLVPPHRICGGDEISQLKKKYQKLALQSRDDPISRFHGLLPGDVVEYTRSRLGLLGGIYYREVF